MRETDVKNGEFYMTRNGNIYLAMPEYRCVYICNKRLDTSDPSDKRVLRRSHPVDVALISSNFLKQCLNGEFNKE